MAKKIPFSVIFATDEDPGFPASELNSHGPTVQGWRTSANSSVQPQELILKFHYPARVCRIQVLGHQFMIPDRIELWLHNAPKDSPTTPSSQNFEYLGFIVLSDNSTSQYKSRELQSVTVTPRMGSHLKLRMGAPYVNDFNDAHQVALIGINVLGMDPVDDTGGPLVAPETLASICDCLSFSMYVEETICDVVKELEAKKHRAVIEERFEYARKLKLCMTALRSAGERLGRYALAKRQAVTQEDFATARLRKEQIEIYRNAVFSQLEVEKLLEKNGQVPENDLISPVYVAKPVLPSPLSLQEVAILLLHDPKEQHSPKPPTVKTSEPGKQDEPYFSPQLSKIGRSPSRNSPTNTGSLRRRNKSAPRNSYEDYEERTLPTLRTSQTNEFLRECQSTAEVEANTRGKFKVMNDREKRQAALPLLVFGTELVELFYSKQFQDREEGLTRLRNILRNPTVIEGTIGPNKVARSSTLLLYRAVRDAVFSVFSQAAETVRALFVDFIPQRISANEVSRCVDRLLPELLAKSGDPSPRIHTLAQHTILSIASCTEVRQQNLVAPALSRPVGSGTHPRLALSRIQMLEQLVLSQGISTDKQSGLTCRSLTECGCSGIHHPSEPVRKVAERVLLLVYRINPRLIRKQLPPDDDITRRNLLYRQLFTEFDKIDKARRSEMMESLRDEQAEEEEGAAFGESWDVEELKVSLPNMANGDKNGCKETVQCSFCDWTCEKDGAQLDKHYWKTCPILMKCPQCQCVLEVSAYSHHLTNECEAKESYVICKRCTEAVHMELYQLHLLEEYCRELPTGKVRCPLCHENIPENGWKKHFLEPTHFCRGNSRRRNGKK